MLRRTVKILAAPTSNAKVKASLLDLRMMIFVAAHDHPIPVEESLGDHSFVSKVVRQFVVLHKCDAMNETKWSTEVLKFH